MSEYAWYPHEGPQIDFCSRGEFEVLYGGAAGGGKTDCLIMEAARSVWHPRHRGLLLRRTFPQAQEIIDRCHQWYPVISDNAYFKTTEKRWYFPSGATIQLGHMQHENDKFNYQGKEFSFIGFDELTQFTASQYLYLFSRCRTTASDLDSCIRATTNPGGIGHSWVKERFIDSAPASATFIDPVTGLSRAFIPAKVYDNPTLVENDPAYIARLEALPEVERKRLLDGDWDSFSGQAFPELSQRVHGCNPFEIPPEWERFMCFDWGYSAPWAACWFAMDFDGCLYLYRELYGGKKDESGVWVGARQTNQQICNAINEAEMEKVRVRIADPACWGPTKLRGRNDMLGPSFVEDAQKFGLFFLKADNDRLRGKSQVHQRFALDEHFDDETGELLDERPRFVAFNNCSHFWRTMGTLQESPRNPEDVDTDQDDHIYDVVRYAMMSRPIIPKTKSVIPPGSFAAERNKLIRARKTARRYGISLTAAYARMR